MIIQSIELSHFRNYDNLKMELDPGITILYGDNAQGKTNLLEAIYISGTSKSHKGSKDREIIQMGYQEAHIRTNLKKENGEHRIDLHMKKNASKGIAIDGVPIRRAADLFGMAHLVFFSPEDLSIIKNGPSERRRFLDMELCQMNSFYLRELIKYNRILNQRNSLLREISFRPDLKDTLEVWDEQLVSSGKIIIAERRKFLEKLKVLVGDTYGEISGKREMLQTAYTPDVEEEEFERKLKENREKDIKYALTSVGPHRDDLLFSVKDMDLRKFGSQGQQRTAALSLKLAEIQMVKETIGEMPILLLDDVLSELDSKRQNLLLGRIEKIQTVITCTGLDEFVKNKFECHRVYEVIDGRIFLK